MNKAFKSGLSEHARDVCDSSAETGSHQEFFYETVSKWSLKLDDTCHDGQWGSFSPEN